jgi:hypothetical protein
MREVEAARAFLFEVELPGDRSLGLWKLAMVFDVPGNIDTAMHHLDRRFGAFEVERGA